MAIKTKCPIHLVQPFQSEAIQQSGSLDLPNQGLRGRLELALAPLANHQAPHSLHSASGIEISRCSPITAWPLSMRLPAARDVGVEHPFVGG